MGKYSIYREGKSWYVILRGEVMYRGESKAECLAWIEENP